MDSMQDGATTPQCEHKTSTTGRYRGETWRTCSDCSAQWLDGSPPPGSEPPQVDHHDPSPESPDAVLDVYAQASYQAIENNRELLARMCINIAWLIEHPTDDVPTTEAEVLPRIAAWRKLAKYKQQLYMGYAQMFALLFSTYLGELAAIPIPTNLPPIEGDPRGPGGELAQKLMVLMQKPELSKLVLVGSRDESGPVWSFNAELEGGLADFYEENLSTPIAPVDRVIEQLRKDGSIDG